MRMNSFRSIAVGLAIAMSLGIAGWTGAAGSASAKTLQTVHKKNFAQRHPTITSAAAGYAAYKVAKTTGRNRAMRGGKKNFAQRHPFMTGIAAAGVTHHVIKKSMKHN